MIVNLEPPEWNQILAILAQAPWNVANPLIMKLGEQLKAQHQETAPNFVRPNGEDVARQ